MADGQLVLCWNVAATPASEAGLVDGLTVSATEERRLGRVEAMWKRYCDYVEYGSDGIVRHPRDGRRRAWEAYRSTMRE
jgi:hypothetical protein